MSKRNFKNNGKLKRHLKALAGFSLIELMVAMSVFLVVGGAAVALMRRHMPLFNTAQNQAGLNVTLRNAVAQLQMEVVNAGTGNAGAVGTGFSPMGVTISKATAATPCNKQPPVVYNSTCFDSFSLISVDTTVPMLAPAKDSGLVASADTSTGSAFLFLSGGGTPAAYTTIAASLPANTELMFVQGGTGVPQISIVVLSANAVPQANGVQIAFTNTVPLNGCQYFVNGVQTSSNVTGVPAVENLGIYNPDPTKVSAACSRFTSTFAPTIDYVIKLVSTASYQVDATDPTNPKLVRKNKVTGASDIIAEQIVGFTVGAWSDQKLDASHLPAPGYTENPLDFNNDWASVRSLRVQITARATPGTDNSEPFQNSYDNGNYQVQGMSVVINPRNMNTN